MVKNANGATVGKVIRGGAAIDRVLSALGLDRLFEIIAAPEQIPGLAAPA